MESTSPTDFTSDFLFDENISNDTPMRNFYRNKNVFLTGATGFLGQLYAEKLLRCQIKKLYILIRAKKGKSPESRMEDALSGTLFSKLKKSDPNYLKRVIVIEGNTSELGLGLSITDLTELIDNIEIIIHAAAEVRFDNTLDEICITNLRGTREILKLAAQMNQLKIFTYISTAYSHCTNLYISNRFYDTPIDPDVMLKIVEHIKNGSDFDKYTLNILTNLLTFPWPNTYTFSKALSEELVRQYASKFPIAVIRPSIVISTHEDPIPAWGDNIFGLNGMLYACGLGILRIMSFNRFQKGEIICADFVINSTLAVIWNICSKKLISSNTKEISPHSEDNVFNITSKDDNVTWGQISDRMRDLFLEYPTKSMVWLHRPNSTNCRFMELIYVILYHVIPALLFDLYFWIVQKKRRFLPIYRKTQFFVNKLKYFMTSEWHFDNSSIHRVYNSMTEDDHKYFPCDVRKYDFNDFSYHYLWGLRTYIGKEPLNNLEESRRKLRFLKLAHYSVLLVYYLGIGLFFYFILRLFGFTNVFDKHFKFVKIM